MRHLLAVGLALLAAAALLTGTAERTVAAPDSRPNILLITTDDMNKTDLRWMPATRRLLGESGVSVDDFISNHPLCCPARAQILTGQHAHNNGVYSNAGPRGGYGALYETGQSGNNVASWLRDSGYQTAFVGKHMNLWPNVGERQPGWTIFNPIESGIYHPFRFTMYNNGRERQYTGTHTSDVMGALTVNYINRFSASGSPFFIWTSQVAPHKMYHRGVYGPPVPAVRHRDLYPNALPPSLSDPAFNEADVTDKPVYVQNSRRVSRAAMIRWHRARIRSLRSVDDQVAAAVKALRATGELANTYVFFTSDNGFMLGEHRRTSKNQPYEQVLQVPLLVRGPGLRSGAVRQATYSLVDLTATFVDIAGATSERRLDGRSMLQTLQRGSAGYGQYLVQAGSEPKSPDTWWWRGVRSQRYVYIRYYGENEFEELYDLAKDPAQLRNLAQDPASADLRAHFATQLTELGDCQAEECTSVAAEEPVVAFARPRQTVQEDTGRVRLRVVRSGDVDVATSVDYAPAGGSATTADFAVQPGTLTFAAGETVKVVSVRVRNDTRTEPDETLRLALTPVGEEQVTVSGGAARLSVEASDQRTDAVVHDPQAKSYVGDDVYNLTGARQTARWTAERGRTRTFRVRVYNDGNVRNTLSLRGSPARAGVRVRYLSGGVNRTRPMTSSRGWRVAVPAGGYRAVDVRLTVDKAAIGSTKEATVRSLWTGDVTRADAVRAVVEVVR